MFFFCKKNQNSINFLFHLIAATSNLYNASSKSYCQYDEILPDTTLLDGYQSVIDVWEDALTVGKVSMLTNSKVNKIRWQNSNDKVIVETENGKTFEADHVIVTTSLGKFFENKFVDC